MIEDTFRYDDDSWFWGLIRKFPDYLPLDSEHDRAYWACRLAYERHEEVSQEMINHYLECAKRLRDYVDIKNAEYEITQAKIQRQKIIDSLTEEELETEITRRSK